jgi:hypothetical protein
MPYKVEPAIVEAAAIEPAIIEIEGRTFVPIDQMPIAPWSCILSEHPISTLTLKDDDLSHGRN